MSMPGLYMSRVENRSKWFLIPVTGQNMEWLLLCNSRVESRSLGHCSSLFNTGSRPWGQFSELVLL